jgi:diguanylate cyclase (GGDEF)-like protein
MRHVSEAVATLVSAVVEHAARLQEALLLDDKSPLSNATALRIRGERLVTATPETHAIVFGDLNRFKSLNDHHGHRAGDAAIYHAGTLLQTIAKELDADAFRKSGDEFVLFVPVNRIEDFSRSARARLARMPFEFESRKLPHLAMSFGYASGMDVDLDELQRRAEEACRAAKLAGDGEVVRWTEQVRQETPRQERWTCTGCSTSVVCDIPRARLEIALRCPVCARARDTSPAPPAGSVASAGG